MSSSNVMWVEKYRPQKISELVNQKEILGSISSMLKNQSEIHNLFQVIYSCTISSLCKNKDLLDVVLEVLTDQTAPTFFPFKQLVLILQAYLHLEFQYIFQILKYSQPI